MGGNIIKEGPANHFLNGEGVGGWIYLTANSLLFKSHSVNIQVHELSVPLESISKATKGRSLGVIPNQLCLTLTDGRTERFVVNKPDEWIATLRDLHPK